MSSRKVRVKKLTIKTTLPVLREDQIDATEYESLLTESQIATGVDQTEENEFHLQSILKEAGTSNDQEIPVPPPQESDINYDGLYPATFHKPSSYIRFSQTVEECISCQYDMTTGDDEFLKSYNSNPTAAGTLSEDDFERIMEVFEDTATEQTPFAAVDNTVVGYDMMVLGLNQLGSTTILQHAKQIYEYWKTRRQEEGNKPLPATIKFETHQETDDTDPYVCFRRREVRQTRKTRSRDTKIAETLKRFRRELEDGRQLVLMAYEREMMKRDLLQVDRAIFEERARLKQIKTKLGIKGDDEDLVNQKSQKRKPAEAAGAQRPTTQVRVPVRPDGRSHEQDLVLLSDQLAEKENELRSEIETKVQNHRRWNQNHIDLTRDPLSPVKELGMELKFRPAKTQYLMTPPASNSAESMDIDDDAPEPMQLDKPELPVFQFRGADFGETPQTSQPAFRRRIGRLQRLWIDRRGLSTPSRTDTYENSDRWKYDSDSDDDEPPVYEVDPFDTRALKFRATIPLSPYIFRARPTAPPEAVNGVANGHKVLPPPPSQAQPQAQPQPPPPPAAQQAQAAS